MITFDMIVFGIIGVSGLIGFIRGFTREVLGFCSWGAALAAAYFGFPFLDTIASQYITNPNIAKAATYISIFVTFLIFFGIISNVLASYIRQTMLSGIDRTLGFGIGLLRAFILLAVLDLASSVFFTQEPAFLTDSKTIPYVHSLKSQLYGLLPKDWKKYIRDNQKNAKDLSEQKVKKSSEQLAQEQEKNAEGLAQLKPQAQAENSASVTGKVVDKIIDDGVNEISEHTKEMIKKQLD